MSQSQSATTLPHSINPSQYERAIAQSARKDHDGQWACKLCDSKFNNTVGLVAHIMTFCGRPLSTFSTESAIRVCVLLDPSGSLEMFESYLRVANEEADDESSDHDSDMDIDETGDSESEGTGDMESEGTGDSESEDESGSDATRSEKDDQLMEEGGAGTEPWWIEEEDQEDEEEEGLESADEDDESSELSDNQTTPAAHHVGPRRRTATGNGTNPPKNQDFPTAPPHSLSADQKREWTFRCARARQIRAMILAHTTPGTRNLDKAAVLENWNSTTHARDWKAGSPTENAATNYRSVADKAQKDRKRLRELTAEAQGRP